MDYIRVLEDLISIDTSVPPGSNYGEAVDYLQPLFQRLGFETRNVTVPREHAQGKEGRVSLICHRKQAGRPRLIVYSHIDVVPAEGWDAFKPRETNGRIYGRGAADMKGAIVALLVSLEAAKEKTLRFDTSVVVTTDEEIGQSGQLHYLTGFLEPVSGAAVFSLDSSFGYVAIANLGVLQMDIRVKGRSVHSGLSHLGENAVERASLLIQALLSTKEKITGRRSDIDVHPSTGLTKMEARLNINKLSGGTAVNIIPDQCLVSLDRRLIPEEDVEEAERELMDALSSVEGVDWEVERVLRIPTVPPCRDPVVDELAQIIEAVTGESGKFGEMISGDLPHVAASAWGAKEFGLGVIRPECNIHGRDEFVYQKDIEDLAQIISRFLSAS